MYYETAFSYVKRIKNAYKHRYAAEYLNYMLTGGNEPEAKCSYMAAQAVRMTIHKILNRTQ